MLSRSVLGSLALLAGEATAYFSYNGLANTPQMGWVSGLSRIHKSFRYI